MGGGYQLEMSWQLVFHLSPPQKLHLLHRSLKRVNASLASEVSSILLSRLAEGRPLGGRGAASPLDPLRERLAELKRTNLKLCGYNTLPHSSLLTPPPLPSHFTLHPSLLTPHLSSPHSHRHRRPERGGQPADPAAGLPPGEVPLTLC